ncbi:MAG: hypothetical protein GWO24_07755 [Akkermansiaceae bacterium]|nr:hypothetical protein [Akkermansiaceae bacterium]
MRVVAPFIALLSALAGAFAEDAEGERRVVPPSGTASDMESALQKLRLPGVKINLAEHSVDVAGEICLEEGMLELVACTRNTKEHESIVVIKARPMHIHTALLLLGAKPGNPAIHKPVPGDETRWISVPPQGGRVKVCLVFKNEKGELVERPIRDFIAPTDPAGTDREGKGGKEFPTDTFLFAGSHLVAEGEGPRVYLGDRSGNVISIATFGDELLCLPDVHSHQNGALVWQVDKTHLPEVGTEVTLRLRPITGRKPRRPNSPVPGTKSE